MSVVLVMMGTGERGAVGGANGAADRGAWSYLKLRTSVSVDGGPVMPSAAKLVTGRASRRTSIHFTGRRRIPPVGLNELDEAAVEVVAPTDHANSARV